MLVSPATPVVIPWKPTRLLPLATYQMLPSPRSTNPNGLSGGGGAKSVLNSVNVPVVVTFAILLVPGGGVVENSVNHRLPSDAPMIICGCAFAVGTVNSVTTPAGVIRATLPPGFSVNHMLPSLPAAIHCGLLAATGIENW